MLCFKKNKIKLSLIEDYISLILFKNFFNNDFTFINTDKNKLYKSQAKLNSLLKLYENAFLKLKMNDLSLLILKKELKRNNYLYSQEQKSNFSTIHFTVEKINNKLTSIFASYKEKQKVLKY